LARLQMKGPVSKKAAYYMVNNPEVYFPLN